MARILVLSDSQFETLAGLLDYCGDAEMVPQYAEAVTEEAFQRSDEEGAEASDKLFADIDAIELAMLDGHTETTGKLLRALIQHHVDNTAAEDTMAMLAEALGTDDYDDRLEAWGKLCSAAKNEA